MKRWGALIAPAGEPACRSAQPAVVPWDLLESPGPREAGGGPGFRVGRSGPQRAGRATQLDSAPGSGPRSPSPGALPKLDPVACGCRACCCSLAAQGLEGELGLHTQPIRQGRGRQVVS